MTDVKWKIEKDLCRCCHSEGSFRNLDAPFANDFGLEEIYGKMLREQLGIALFKIEGIMSEVTYTICEGCIFRLREATDFKRQVLSCEEKFHDMFNRNMFTVSIPPLTTVKKEVHDEIDLNYVPADDDGDMGADDDDNYSLEDLKFSEDDDKPLGLSSIKKETPQKKRKTTVKPANKVTKKTTTKKAAKSKTKAETTQSIPATSAEKKQGQRAKRFQFTEEDFSQDGDTYTCKRCGKRYDKFESLKYHIRAKYYKIPRFKCPLCEKEFMTPAPLTTHKLEVHNVDDRHKCNACKGAFNTKIQLRKHINNFHMLGEKHKCEFCDYETFSFEGLYKHKFKHKTVKDYHCRFCRKSFLRKTTLDLHERIHTGDRRKVCTVCGQAFVQKASLNYHMAKYHPEINF
ncbi:unnamed protein product [Plutella xylostella]|uniref:(diamondback moth) hypothetical protein n=1 Tax=Plutella xylostella TaxID=51655 RepID=A0A8S4DZ66_PLUXY|nr:unnamed protein product [Plutella xylostella]